MCHSLFEGTTRLWPGGTGEKKFFQNQDFPESEIIWIPSGCELERHAIKVKGEIVSVLNQLSTTP
jgi:hypothetical protein